MHQRIDNNWDTIWDIDPAGEYENGDGDNGQ